MSDDVGATLRSARDAASLSLSALAKLTNYSRCHLSNVETGRRRATPDVHSLRKGAVQQLGHGHRSHDAGGEPGEQAAAVHIPSFCVCPLQRAFVGKPEPVQVEEWWHRAEAYGQDYMTLGAEELSARLVGDLVRLNQHVDNPAVWGPAARLMTVYGKTLPANDGSTGAVRWYRLAAEIADRSGDLPTRVWVRGRSALALAYEAAQLPTARGLAREALALADGKPSLGRLNAIVAQAHVAGARGDRDSAARLMNEAATEFERVGSAEQVSDFAVPEWRFWTFASMLYARLGDQPRGQQAQDSADGCRPDTLPRFATHIELHRGLMLVRAGDRRAGIECARDALGRLPPEKRSLSLRLMMAEIQRHSPTTVPI